MWSVSVAGGEPTLLLENAAFPSYLPSGEIVSLSVWAADQPATSCSSAVPTVIAERFEGDEIWFPRASPDGTKSCYGDMGRIYVVEVATGEFSSVVDGNEAAWLDDDTLIVNGL